MREAILKIGLTLLILMGVVWHLWAKTSETDYVVLVGKSVYADVSWDKVVNRLTEIHQAKVVNYDKLPSEALPLLKELSPRYVAVIEKPEYINRDFIINLNRMSREIDDDFYGDFLWGIITGYDADAALRLVERAQNPKEIKSAWCIGVNDFKDGKYFEQMGLSTEENEWREKNTEFNQDMAGRYKELANKVVSWGEQHNPDLIIYQVEEFKNQFNLVSLDDYREGKIVPRQGKLWWGDRKLKLGNNSRVCFTPMSGANTFGTKESVPVVWLSDLDVTALIGSMEISFHGRGEWGTLKYWMTDAGRFTLAEAHFLNQQDMLCKLNRWSPKLLQECYKFNKDTSKLVLNYYRSYNEYESKIEELTGSKQEMLDKFSYLYERDIMVYYGDPAWNVRVKDLSDDQPYIITSKVRGKKCIVTIKTTASFSWERLGGEIRAEYSFGDRHCAVGYLPICYFFPQRLHKPQVARKQKQQLDIVVNKDFLFVYEAYWEPNKTYQIILDLGK